jgi:FkbM family methyltransferase
MTGSNSNFRKLLKKTTGLKGHRDALLLLAYWKNFRIAVRLLKNSNSQISQDVFVLLETIARGKVNSGFFVEFGAADGITLSNTLLLEKKFGWNGILAEPAVTWHQRLLNNRECKVDFRCVHSISGVKLSFEETTDALFSTQNSYLSTDLHHELRREGTSYSVESVSLNDLLSHHNSPINIDYMSIDTEGSELEILSNFDFSKYRIRVITVEHNFGENRSEINGLLLSKGYKQIHKYVSLFDDWYILVNK